MRGALGREEGLEETVSFARKARGRLRGQVGSAPLFTVGKEALEGLAEALKGSGTGLHVPLAEDPLDEKLSTERFGASPVTRLVEGGLVSPQTVLAHVGHLAWPELAQLLPTGCLLYTSDAADE